MGDGGRMFPLGWIETAILLSEIAIFGLLDSSDPFRLTQSGHTKIK
jgi:hypothetical protein